MSFQDVGMLDLCETAYGEHRHALEAFFMPRSIAVIGATDKPGKVGCTILSNLINSQFKGQVYPINPNREELLGRKAFPNIGAVPDEVDLAVIVTPAPTVPGVMSECVAAHVKAAIIISAGFKETGPEGLELERQVLREAQRGGIRIIGPNCLGVMRPHYGVNATFAAGMARPGSVAFLSQSGALCTAVLDWSLREMVGFSAFISIGSMLDVGWGDLIEYFGDDPRTSAIVLYMETVGDPRPFLSAAREVALKKPIIVIKAGRTEQAAKATVSHTGSMAGSDDVLDAAFLRCGVLRVNNIADIFYMAEVLSKQPRPKGPRLTILTNAGGPAVLATDSLILNGGELAQISPKTMTALNEFLPPHWSHNNPIDILGDADPERYAKAVEIAAKDPNSDGLLVILTPQDMTDPTKIAQGLTKYAKSNKPIIASWMGGVNTTEGEGILNQAGIPTFPYPDTAARAFDYMWHYSKNLQALYETPSASDTNTCAECARAEEMINEVRRSGRTVLTEVESKQVLSAYGIPTVQTRVAKSEEEAVAAAGAIGYPVVLKLFSETITHKTDIGGVKLNLKDEGAVRAAFVAIRDAAKEHFLGVTVQPMIRRDGYELILGSSIDSQFGPVLLFGTGGQLVEVFQDRALGLPPLNTTLARRMMEQTKIYKALQGVRGRKPVDQAVLERLVVRFSELVAEQKWIKEIDINPLLASPEGLLALDARIVLHGLDVNEEQLPKLAIRPYPTQYVEQWTMTDGAPVTLRPIRPEDEPMLVAFHEGLSDYSVYMRYFTAMKLDQRIEHQRLTQRCFIDYDREMAFVAEYDDPRSGIAQIAGISRMTRLHGTNDAEVAVIVSDRFHHRGLGTELMRQLIAYARDEKLRKLEAYVLPDNPEMQRILKKVGFTVEYSAEERMMRGTLWL